MLGAMKDLRPCSPFHQSPYNYMVFASRLYFCDTSNLRQFGYHLNLLSVLGSRNLVNVPQPNW